MRRNISCYNTPGTDNRTLSDRHASTDDHIGCQPTIVFNDDRFGVFQIIEATVISLSEIAFFRYQWVHWCSYGYVGANKHIITDLDRTNIQTGKVEIGAASFSEGGIAAVIKIYRSLQVWDLCCVWQQNTQQLLLFVCFILIRLIKAPCQFACFYTQAGQLFI